MIYDATERARSVASADFTTFFDALLTAKSLTGLGIDTSVTVYDRRGSQDFADVKDGLPGLGVYPVGAQTETKRQEKRDSNVQMVYDYLYRGTDGVVVSKAVELAAEALMQCVDKLSGGGQSGTQVISAGDPELSVSVQIMGMSRGKGQNWYEDGVVVTFPITERDEIS